MARRGIIPGIRSLLFGEPARGRLRSEQPPTPTRVRYDAMGPQPVAFAGGATSGYGSAKATADYTGGKPRQMSPHAHSEYQLEELVAESQRMRRDNTLYRTIIRRMADVVVGSGLAFQARTSDPTLNDKIEKMSAEFWASPEVRGLCGGVDFERMLIDQKLTDGRSLLVWDSGSGKVQVVSGDRLHSDKLTDDAKRPIYHGVAVDPLLRPVNFHVCDWGARGTYLREATTLGAADVYYDAFLERFDQVAAPPLLQAVFPMLHRINDVLDSEAASWQLMARFAASITKKDAAQTAWGTSQAETGDTTGKLAQRVSEESGYALLFYGEPGEEIKGIERNVPGANFGSTIREFTRFLVMEIGISLEFFLLDWSQTNYSSGRAAARQLWRHAIPWQIGLSKAKSWVHERWIDRMVTLGKLPEADDIYAHEWIEDPFEPLDPDKETTADANAVKSGFKTATRVLKERRIEFAEHIAERSKELATAAEAVKKHNEAHPDVPVTIASYLTVAAETETAPAPTEPGTIVGAEGTVVTDGVVTTLNGAQITAAVGVVQQYQIGVLSKIAAIELLTATGIPRETAMAIVNSIEQKQPEPEADSPQDEPSTESAEQEDAA